MDTTDFFLYLLAALRLRGIQFLDTREDRHHRMFEVVVESLGEQRIAGRRLVFIPGPFSGQYRELDAALVSLQSGGYVQGGLAGTEISMSPGRARAVLKPLPESERELFAELAKVADGYFRIPSQ